MDGLSRPLLDFITVHHWAKIFLCSRSQEMTGHMNLYVRKVVKLNKCVKRIILKHPCDFTTI